MTMMDDFIGNCGANLFCVLSGFLLGNLPEEHLSHLNMGSVTKGEVVLMLPKNEISVWLVLMAPFRPPQV